MKKAVVSLVITLLIGLGMWQWKKLVNSGEVVEIETVNVEITDINNYITMRGKVTEKARYDVFTGISGIVSEVYVSVGDSVTNGQKLMRIVPSEGESDTSNLYNEIITAVSGMLSSFIDGNYNASTAEGVSLVSADEDGSCIILSPCSGTIMSLQCVPQQFVSSKYPCMVISDLKNLAIKAEIEEQYLTQINEDMKCTAIVEALSSRPVKCIIDHIDPHGTSNISITGASNVVTEVMLSVNDENAIFLRPGYTAKINVITESKENVLLVPYEAISQDKDNNQFVYSISNGKLEKIIVETGKELDSKTEIISGLTGNETIVMYPDTIKSGSKVKLK